MTQSTKKLDLEFTSLEFFDSMVVSTVKEDTIVEKEHIEELRKICTSHFGNKSFVYVTHRKYNYNVNPVIYIDLIQINTLKGIAVISEKIERLKTANFEKNFSPVPYEIFQHKEEALIWAKGVVSAE